MIDIPNAPWIREAERRGYPVDERDGGEMDIGDCPMMFRDWGGESENG